MNLRMSSKFRSVIVGLIVVFSILSSQAVLGASHVLINEVVSSNLTSIVDEDGNSSDWIELYNPDDVSVRLGGYSLSDDPRKPHMWTFPDIVLQSHSFLLVFASKKNRSNPAQLHTNFKISAAGEMLLLSSPDFGVVDSISVPSLQADQSYGRLPDGGTSWTFMNSPTPGDANSVSGDEDRIAQPVFSSASGFYNQPVLLNMSTAAENVSVRYTLDGKIPDSSATLYHSAIFIDTTTVVRAAAFLSDGRSSGINTATFIINESFDLPVVSLTTDPKNLWDPDIGIYAKGGNARDDYPYKGANFWREWERPIHIEFFEPDQRLAFTADAGVRIFGHSSVGAPFKPLVFYARKQYGDGSFKHQIFPDKDIHEFEAFMLRNSGNDWNRTLFRDAFMHELASEIRLPGQAYRPAIVFINGVYWGLQNLRERMNEHYVASNFHVETDAMDLMAWNYGLQVYAGDDILFKDLRNFVKENDLSVPENYSHASSLIHVGNFIDYFIMQVYCNNRDWPSNNQYLWRPRQEGGRWMWLLKDMDHGFGYEVSYNYNSLVRNALKDDLFPHFLENPGFRVAFINRFTFLMNTLFRPSHVNDVIAKVKWHIEPEVPRHIQRWADAEAFGNPPTSMQEWDAYCEELNLFAEKRIPVARQQLRDYFKLGELIDVTINIDSPDMGTLRIENQPLQSSPWHGQFYKGVPLVLEAKPRTGYRFAGWEGLGVDSDSVILVPESDLTITAKFNRINSQGISVVINEINYHSNENFDPGDWIELTNPTDAIFSLAGWTLRDDNDNHVFHFPRDLVLPPFSFIVICRNLEKFTRCFPKVQNVISGMDFGLSSAGDAVRLYDEYGLHVDAVEFGVKAPWPEHSNGTGATLALMHPFRKNTTPGTWFSSFPHGSPGRANIRFAPIDVKNLFVQSREGGKLELQWTVNNDAVGSVFRVQRNCGDGWKVVGDNRSTINPMKNTFQFTDTDVQNSASYRLEYVNSDGALSFSEPLVVNAQTAIESDFIVENFPNPFNSRTVINFYLPADQFVDIKIFNVRGQLVSNPASEMFPQGEHNVAWNSEDLSSGLYFCKIKTDINTKILKITLQR
jgi:hypothetical protein